MKINGSLHFRVPGDIKRKSGGLPGIYYLACIKAFTSKGFLPNLFTNLQEPQLLRERGVSKYIPGMGLRTGCEPEPVTGREPEPTTPTTPIPARYTIPGTIRVRTYSRSAMLMMRVFSH